ncbi:MAG: caspase family protein [Novosphingobium sp.]
MGVYQLRHSNSLRTMAAGLLALGLALAGGPPASAKNADDLLVVDCLLPGSIQRLGTGATYVKARKPIKTTAGDCRRRGGEYTEAEAGSYAALMKMWLPLAKSGDAEAQTTLGEIFEKGTGGPPQPDLAVQWYTLAADQGYSRAQVNLGSLYERGFGVAKNPRKAMELYRRASGLEGASLDFTPTPPAPSSAELARLRKERDALEQQLAAERQRREQLEAELKAVGTKLNGERSSLEQQESELDEARRQLAAQTKALEKQRKQAEKASGDQQTAAAQEVARLQRQLEDQRKAVAQRDTQLQSLQKSVAKLESQSSQLQAKLVQSEQQRAELATAVSSGGQLRKSSGGTLEAAPPPPPRVNFGRYHALVIGNNNFRFIPKLRTAVIDAQAVAQVLRDRYGFKVTVLLNADRYQLLSALNQMRERLTPEDNLLIYYAGHGELDRVNSRGYWLPVDAESDSTANWIPAYQVTDILNAMSAKQVMLVADSCYSGMLTRSAIARLDTGMTNTDRNRWFQAMATKHARVVLTSGGVQPVLDGGGGRHSVFAAAFIESLEQNGDVLEGQKLAQDVTKRVAISSAAADIEQVPEYAPIRFAGHEAGDFFFVPK